MSLSLTNVSKASDALKWLSIIYNTLGPHWANPQLFRLSGEGLAYDLQGAWSQMA